MRPETSITTDGPIKKDDTVNSIIAKYPKTMGIFTTHSIDSCCGGEATLEEAALRDSANLEELLDDLNTLLK